MSYEPKLLSLLAEPDYAPQTVEQLGGRLGLSDEALPGLRREVDELLRLGRVVRVKRDRLCLPRDADLVSGRIVFRQSGAATLFPDESPGTKVTPLPVRSEDTWVALHGDRVLCRLVEAPRRPRYVRGRDGRAVTQAEGPSARVIRILERARTQLTGTLQRGRAAWFVIPDDPRLIQDILVADPEKSGLTPVPKVDDKVVVRLAEWKQRHLNPEGELVQVLGRSHTPGAEYRALLTQFHLSPEFPPEVDAEAAALPVRVPESDCTGRRDLRDTLVFTIDPDDAKDFDDALSWEPLKGGDTRVGIHIADVSHYVRPGTALDREAARRGNSTYLVGRVIPMLPHALSDGLCSLVEGETRLTKSVFVTYTKTGRVKATEFANTVICSRKRLTYKQALALLEENNYDALRATPAPKAHQTGATGRPLASLNNRELGELQEAVRGLWGIGAKLRAKRMAAGSLDLEFPEVKIYVDPEGYPDRIERIFHDASHQLVEEFMLTANESIARQLLEAQLSLIHRVHDEPEAERLDELRDYLTTFGILTGDLTNRREVTALLATLREHPQGIALRTAFLRSLKQAKYSAEPTGHYGLNKKFYAHFTSPIRRYADLIAHRVFDRYLHKQGLLPPGAEPPPNYGLGQLALLAEAVTQTEQNSTEAERESVKIKLLEYFEREMQKPEKAVFDALVTDVKNHGLFIELVESQAYGLVHISTLTDDLYVVTDDGTAIVGRRTHRRFALGQRLKVQVERLDRFKRQIDFRLANVPQPSPPPAWSESVAPANRAAAANAHAARHAASHPDRFGGRLGGGGKGGKRSGGGQRPGKGGGKGGLAGRDPKPGKRDRRR